MKFSPRYLVIGSILLLSVTELVPTSPMRFGLIGDAHAIIGRPATPLSVAGVARRDTRRVVAVEATAASASAASAQAAAAKAAAATPPPAGAPIPVGTIVHQLPPGCVSAPVSGVEYYLCGGNYYRASFQGNNLVYVVQRP